MPRMDQRTLLGLAENSNAVAGNGAANAVQIGSTILDAKVRRVYRMTARNPGAAAILEVYQGDAAVPNRALLGSYQVPAAGNIEIGVSSGPQEPFLTVRPDTTPAPAATQGNQIRISDNIGGAVVVAMSHYDVRG